MRTIPCPGLRGLRAVKARIRSLHHYVVPSIDGHKGGDPTRLAVTMAGFNRPPGEGPLEFDSNYLEATWIAAFSLYSSWGYTWADSCEIADYEVPSVD